MPDSLRQPTALPIYMQISEALIREIASGRLLDGERLLPERDLAQQYGTTVRTLRKALAELEQKGLLERRQGSGNYVRSAGLTQTLYSMFRLELHKGGGLPTADFLSVDEMTKPTDLPGFGASPRATRMRRLRFLSGTPVALEEIWLDRASGAVDPNDLSDSLYHFYKTRLHLWVSRAEDRVSVAPTPDWAPTDFAPEAGTVVGYVERLSWAQADAPVEFSRTWFDPARAQYVQRLI